MRTTLTALLVLMLSVSAMAKQPIGFKHWQLENDTAFAKQIGGAVRNYQKPDKDWDSIVNSFEIEGDSVVFVEKSVLRSRINKNGISKVMLTWNDQEYTITQKLLGIGWIKISTRQSQWIDSTMDWGNFSVDSNICKWTGVSPGFDYRVLKRDGLVAHGAFYKPAFLDSAVILYDQRPDSLDIALANVMVYTLSANIDDHDSAIGELSWRRLKDFGYYSFKLTEQRLHFPGSETLQRIPVKQYWERRGTNIVCVEYVMMSKVKKVHEAYPSATIWHNDVKKIEGTTNVEDTWLFSSNATFNYGGDINFSVSSNRTMLIRFLNLDTEIGVGATITGAVCSIYCETNVINGTVSAYSNFKPWLEGTQEGASCVNPGCSWNHWDCGNAKNWGTSGAGCANNDGVDNSQDGTCDATGRDIKATAEDVNTVNATGWWIWDISTELAQAWYDGTKNEEGIALTAPDGANVFTSTEGASNQPFAVFIYTTEEPEAAGQMMMIQ